jgi:hypothetical protein
MNKSIRYKNIGVISSHIEVPCEGMKAIRHYSFNLYRINIKVQTTKGSTNILLGFGGFGSVVKAHRAMMKMYRTGKEPF